MTGIFEIYWKYERGMRYKVNRSGDAWFPSVPSKDTRFEGIEVPSIVDRVIPKMKTGDSLIIECEVPE